ncbi:MAG: cyclic pyranopterin monophosphate synthase MoaC [Alphaproteobacteria bacterium]|nr:cyclic pyranopterin monophosphate synthase MoaC [Alphaproteobacteria bacterium]
MAELTHFDDAGNAHMVDVGGKAATERIARAAGRVIMAPATLALIQSGGLAKGDVLGVARLAGIMAAKRTADLIPLCHPLQLSSVSLELSANSADNCVEIIAEVKLTGRTGVEMEALTAVSVAGLTIYDMCKAVDRGMRLTEVRLVHKSGGKSGAYDAP